MSSTLNWQVKTKGMSIRAQMGAHGGLPGLAIVGGSNYYILWVNDICVAKKRILQAADLTGSTSLNGIYQDASGKRHTIHFELPAMKPYCRIQVDDQPAMMAYVEVGDSARPLSGIEFDQIKVKDFAAEQPGQGVSKKADQPQTKTCQVGVSPASEFGMGMFFGFFFLAWFVGFAAMFFLGLFNLLLNKMFGIHYIFGDFMGSDQEVWMLVGLGPFMTVLVLLIPVGLFLLICSPKKMRWGGPKFGRRKK